MKVRKFAHTIAIATLALSCMVPLTAQANSTGPIHLTKPSEVYVNYLPFDSMYYYFGAADPYMPINNVIQILSKETGISIKWNGNLYLNVPSTFNLNGSPVPINTNQLPTASTSTQLIIYLNNTPIQVTDSVDYVGGSVKTPTTYVPIADIMKLLKLFNFTSKWDGNNLYLTYAQQAYQIKTSKITLLKNGKFEAAAAFAKALGLSPVSYQNGIFSDFPDNNPNDGYAYAAIQKGYIQPDSSTKFGVNDAVSTTEFDQWFAHHFGINSNNIVNNPGSNFLSWGNIVELNSGVGNTNALSTGNINTMTGNIANIDRGYKSLGNGKYQLLTIPENEAPKVTGGGIPLPAMVTGYETTGTVNVSTLNGYLTISFPALSNSSWHWEIGNTVAGIQYSTNNGSTWTTGKIVTFKYGQAVMVRVHLGNFIDYAQTYSNGARIPYAGISSTNTGSISIPLMII